jgi:predicted nucleic acid-binding protein
MKYVLDTSVAFKWVVPETDSDKAIRLRNKYWNAIHELIAPEFFATELAHALAKAERRKPPIITVGQAELLWLDAMTTPPVLLLSLPITQRAIQIASQARVGVYDCVYVSLAEREKCELLTADDKLIKNLQAQFPFIKALASMP